MQIDTAVRTAKVVQATSLFVMIGVVAYASKKQRELISTIAANEQRMAADTAAMRDAVHRITHP
jgi:hypothetical protein